MAIAWEIVPRVGGLRELHPTKEDAMMAMGSLYRHRWHGPTEVEGDFVFLVLAGEWTDEQTVLSIHRTYAGAVAASRPSEDDEIKIMELTP